MQDSGDKNIQAEFLCPDCGFANKVGAPLLAEKYREHQVKCQQCNHLLEIIVADGIHNRVNVVASSLHDDYVFQ